MELLILLLSFCLTIEYRQLSKYGSISISGTDEFYLRLDDFKSGDNVYIEVSYSTYWYFTNSYSFYYRQSNYLSDSEFSTYSFSYMSSSTSSTSNDRTTRYYTIKLTGNYQYLLFKFSATNSNTFTIKHSKVSITWIIITSISIFVGIIALIVIIRWCKRRAEESYTPTRMDDPLVSTTYPVVQPQIQPQIQPQPQPQPIYTQPGYQPYIVQPGYTY